MADPEIPKLRMAPHESAEELAHRYEREKRAVNVQREDRLERGLEGFRVGSVPYLNAVPLTRGLEEQIQFVVPSRLAEMLRRDELDAALVSITEVLFNDRYDVLDEIAIASLGEVISVFLAHQQPLEQIREIHVDTASLTSVNLLRALLAERGLHPEFKPLPAGDLDVLPPNVLLIGDQAIHFRRKNNTHEIWDLGAAWYDMFRLPFVYAIWALRRGIPNEPLKRQLREAKSFGLDTLDYIISSGTEFDLAFRQDYLGWHVHFHLGADEKRGIAKFIELLRKHSGQPVFDPRFVA